MRASLGLLAVATVAFGGGGDSRAAEYLGDLQSEVYPAAGDQAAIMAAGKTCVAQQLAPGLQGGQLIVSETAAALVANSVATYPDGLMRWRIRSTVTFEARDGRFRITQSRIERFNDQFGGWQPVGKWTGSGWKKAEAAIQSVTADLAACVQRPAAPRSDF